jgi:hypothetical protein
MFNSKKNQLVDTHIDESNKMNAPFHSPRNVFFSRTLSWSRLGCLAFVLNQSAHGQEPTEATQSAAPKVTAPIRGKILARGSGIPLADATVIDVASRENSVTTDKNGEFEILLSKPDGAFLIRAQGFDDFEVKVEKGVAAPGPYLMEPAPEVISRGIIRARRKTEISQQSLTREEVSRIPGTGGDAVASLQSLPSVLPAGFGNNIAVRGSAPGDTSYYYDKLSLPFVFHFGGGQTVIPTRALDGIELYAGGFSAIYGDAIGGVVQLRSETETPQRASGQFELGLGQTSLYLEGRMGEDTSSLPQLETSTDKPAIDASLAAEGGTKSATESSAIGYRLGFRRTYFEIFAPIIKKVGGDRVNFLTLPQATDYMGMLNGKNAFGTWQLYLIGAADRMRLAVSSDNSDTATGKVEFDLFSYFQTLGLRTNSNLGNGWGLSLTPQQRYFVSRQTFFDNKVRLSSHLYSLDAALDKRVNKSFAFTVGMRPEYELYNIDVDAIQIPASGPGIFFDPDTAPRSKEKRKYTSSSGTVYLDTVFKPVNSFTLNPGLIYQRGRNSGQVEIDPRFGARLEVVPGYTIKGSWGYYSQRPQPQFDSKEYGNAELDMERAIHAIAGVEVKLPENWEGDVQVYEKKMLNLVGDATEEPEKKYENNVLGRSKGAEFFLKSPKQGRWYGWGSYGYSKSERRDPRSKQWQLFQYDRPHSLTVVGSYKVTGRWEIGSKFKYQSGSVFTKVAGGKFNQNTGGYVPDSEGVQVNGSRLPVDYQLDIRSDYDFLFPTWKLDFYVDIQNVTNRENVVGRRYSRDYSQSVDVTGIPILPTLGFIASF